MRGNASAGSDQWGVLCPDGTVHACDDETDARTVVEFAGEVCDEPGPHRLVHRRWVVVP